MYVIAPISMITCWAARSNSPSIPGIKKKKKKSRFYALEQSQSFNEAWWLMWFTHKPSGWSCSAAETRIVGASNSTNQPWCLQPPRPTTQSRPCTHWEWPASCGTPTPADTLWTSLMGFTTRVRFCSLQTPRFRDSDSYVSITSPCLAVELPPSDVAE